MEYEVKAAYLSHFARFVEWPAETFDGDAGPLVIGVLGDDPFEGALEQQIGKLRVSGRDLVIKRGPRLEALGRTQILFISASESLRLPKILAGVSGHPVLTVGDTEGFAARGGIVNFTIRNHRVRLEINVERAKAAQLKISSQLLKLATIVQEESR